MPPTRSERVSRASQERRAQQKEDVRQAILQAAAEVFQQKGYEGFSMRQIAERIGYTATTIYLYFQDKDDLLFTLVKERYARFRQMQAEAAAQHQDPLKRLRALGQAYIDFGMSDPAFFRGAFMQRTDILARVIGVENLQSGGDLAHQAIRDGMEAGLFQPGNPEEVAHALWATMFGIVGIAVTVPTMSPEEIHRMAETAFQLLIKGLRS